MISPKPLVSICIPAFNREDFIWRALESCIHQTYKNIEIVVVDNASTDGTEDVVRKYVNRDSRISYHRNRTNIGSGRNFLECVKRASGEFVQALGSDDWLSRNYVAECMAQFQKHPRAGSIATHNIAFRAQAGKPLFFLDALKLPEGVYSAEWYFKHIGREPGLGGFGFISMMRREDALRALSEELANKEYLLNRNGIEEPIDDMIYFRVLAPYSFFILSKSATYVKVVHTTNTGLSGDIIQSVDQLPYFLTMRKAQESFYRRHKPKLLKNLRLFWGLEIAKRGLLDFLVRILKLSSPSRRHVEHVGTFFGDYSFFEKMKIAIYFFPFVIWRLVGRGVRLFEKQQTFSPTQDHFLNDQLEFVVK